jgi:hypothetical protein
MQADAGPSLICELVGVPHPGSPFYLQFTQAQISSKRKYCSVPVARFGFAKSRVARTTASRVGVCGLGYGSTEAEDY